MDRISGLPDELLINILLSLPTKVAVSTSLLSKRWEFLWMWLPRLEYDDRYYSEAPEGKSLQCFLDRNMSLHKAPVIESLCLKLWDSHFKPEDIKLWVVIAVSRCVRELKIAYSPNPPPEPSVLPSSLYVCKSLVLLKLSGSGYRGTILVDVPRLGCLASLGTLQLHCVRYFNEDSFRRLLSICPALKHLSVERCKDDNMGTSFTIIMRSLLSLSILIVYDCNLDGYVIDTPSLEHFKLRDYNEESHYCLIENMPMLKKAYVDVSFSDITVSSLIGAITSVMRLTICSTNMYGDGFVFKQLVKLKLCVTEENSSKLLVQLLKNSPNLRVLKLYRNFEHDTYVDFIWNQPNTVPECLLSSLQTFKWSIYRGSSEERDLVVYILKNARHLRTTTIVSYKCDKIEPRVIHELALCSRASTMCQFTSRII